jgi:hypothetical protein
MEALMNPRSFPFKLTPEDRVTIRMWKWRLAAVYGTALVVLALMVAVAPRDKPDSANSAIASSLPSGAIAGGRPTN